MRFLSLFSGIEAASVAWLPLGWHCAAVAEVEPFPCALLKHHYPNTPNLGDVTKITAEQIKALGHVDMVCGGFPCQDLSVAGKRKGMQNADGTSTRSGLFYDAMRIAAWANPRWLFIENVPGMFSSNAGRDFAAVVGEMAGCEFSVPPDGWQSSGVAVGPLGLVEWTVLDAQYHGLAQRRRRVFLVRDSGDWANRPPLFLESYRLQRHPAPSRQARQSTSRGIEIGSGGGRFTDVNPTLDAGAADGPIRNQLAGAVAVGVTIHGTDKTASVASYTDVACALRARPPGGIENSSTTVVQQPVRNHEAPYVAYTLPINDMATRHAGTDSSGNHAGKGHGLGIGGAADPMFTLTKGDKHAVAIVFDTTQITSPTNQSNPKPGDPCHTPAKGAHAPAIAAFKGGQGASAGGIGYDEHVAPTLTSAESGSNRTPTLMQGMQVRRLTPRECERLQGFPETQKCYTILVCQNLSDQQKTNAFAALQCRKSPSNAWTADAGGWTLSAQAAADHSSTSLAAHAPPVALDVLIDLERQEVRLHSAGRSFSLAASADAKSEFPLPTGIDSFAHLAALTAQTWGRIIQGGKAESLPNTTPSTIQLNGSNIAIPFGQETDELAEDARNRNGIATAMRLITSTTLLHGLDTATLHSTLTTLCCSVARAIAGCIPETMSKASCFAVRLTSTQGYTLVPHRGKPAADGPRYKAIGNSWAVPCARWIGERIMAVDAA